MSNEDLDSQLSAMFDGELPEGECELVARRLSRDADLRQRWHHYAVIGAAIRAERGVRLDDRLARRVRAAMAAEPDLVPDAAAMQPAQAAPAASVAATAAAGGATARAPLASRWLRPVAAVGIAASVAAFSILWLRAQVPAVSPLVAGSTAAPASAAVVPLPVDSPEARPGSASTPYTVPPPVPERAVMAQADLANYVVAHSEYSSPLTRRFPLSAIVSSERPADTAGATEVQYVPEAGADARPPR